MTQNDAGMKELKDKIFIILMLKVETAQSYQYPDDLIPEIISLCEEFFRENLPTEEDIKSIIRETCDIKHIPVSGEFALGYVSIIAKTLSDRLKKGLI